MPGAKARLRLDGADPINRGLVGFWPLTDGGGTRARDASAYRRAGTLTNFSLTSGSGWASSGIGPALTTDGTNDFVNLGPNVITQNGNYTISMWVKYNTANRPFFARGIDGVSPGFQWGMNAQISASNIFEAAVVTTSGGATQYTATGVTTLTSGVWYNVAWVYTEASTLNSYLNGRAEGNVSLAGTSVLRNSTAETYIGVGSGGGPVYFNGSINNVRIWKRSLAPVEIARLYRNPWVGTASPVRPVPFIYPPLSATINATIPITAQITAALQPFDVGGDTHDGLRRSRRLRRIEALRQRADAEKLADAQALRLSLEAALGLAAEIPPDDAPRVAEAVQRAPKAADVDWRRVADDAEQYARLSRVVSRLSAVVQAEAKRRADADDDDDAAFLLGIA